jgi:hypothetical protein
MKKALIPLLAGTLLAVPSGSGQPAQSRPQPALAPAQISDVVRFDLDFPGGTPRQLVEEIEKASGKPLNAVIPDDDADVRLPPLKMRAVNVAELFEALFVSSQKTIPVPGGNFNSAYGFKTMGNPSKNSVWYFFSYKPPVFGEKKACRFYELGSYLETYKVEDITTAIQTGWKMLGETNTPTISYHKDTKLLIVVGEPSKLQLIDSVLQQLDQGRPQPKREASGAKGAQPPKQ